MAERHAKGELYNHFILTPMFMKDEKHYIINLLKIALLKTHGHTKVEKKRLYQIHPAYWLTSEVEVPMNIQNRQSTNCSILPRAVHVYCEPPTFVHVASKLGDEVIDVLCCKDSIAMKLLLQLKKYY